MPPDLYVQLLVRTKRALKARGMKSALAQRLGVPRQRVTEWLSGAGAPTAAKTLELLAWVEATEASQQQKTPDVLLTRPGQKTRKSKTTSDEKAKSDRPQG